MRASRQHLLHLAARLSSATARCFEQFSAQIKLADANLLSLNPTAILARGYSVTRNSNKEIVRDAAKIADGERIVTTLARGEIESEVKKRS